MRYVSTTTLLWTLWLAASPGFAAGRVELELVTEERVPITAQQEWLRRLAEVGVGNLRIRGGGAPAKVGIVVRGTETAPVYAVTGIIASSGDLLLPDHASHGARRFRPADAARAAQWLDDLARFGPADRGAQKSAFGLTAEQFQQVHDALAQPVGFSTAGVSRRDVVEKIGARLGTDGHRAKHGPLVMPLGIEPELVRAMQDDLVVEELSSLSCGTALACAVRPLGMCLLPRASGPGGLECVLVKARPNIEAWPVGWEPEERPGDVLPGLFEFLNVNVEGVAVTEVLRALGDRLKVPVLLDHNALARHGVEPEKALVSLPQRRTSYTLLLRKALAQAGLKSELRVDEAGKPFLWITTIKPL